MDVFLLQHVHVLDDVEEIKRIGVYSTRRKAEAAIQRLADKPGFVDIPEGFDISEITVDTDHWTEGYVTVSPYDDDDDSEEESEEA